jgi:PKD repeat protein
MKKLYFTLFSALLFCLPALANDVIVKGYVTYSNGVAAANQWVFIQTDSLTSPAGCHQYSQVVTNANGYYIDTLSCTNGNIVKVRITLADCNGTILTENPQVNTTTNVVDRNFVLSCTPQQTCNANFNFNIQSNIVSFMSVSTSSAGNAIVAWHWNLGDGSNFSNASPNGFVHQYANWGTYTVKLKIETVNGCTDSITKVITVANTSGTCQANFKDSLLAPNKFVFLSGASTSAPGTTISNRVWSFGDGYYNTNNQVNVDHIYQQPGTYTVCLRIYATNGCVDSVCKVITVGSVPAPNCNANFSFQTGSNGTVYFANTSTTNATGGVQYSWNFGNGQTSSQPNPNVTYATAGTYNVCLVMYANGCVDTVCKTVTVTNVAPPVPCNANFSYQVGANGNVIFTNTSSTLGTNAQYYWSFGNGLFNTGVNASYQYQPGTYTVCLAIYNANCADSICKVIVIPPFQNPTPCQAVFSYVGQQPTPGTNGYTLQFNSANSHATSAAGDSIAERTWIWGDGSTTTGNLVNPTHTYTTPGIYNVCLIIKSKNNCIDSTCKTVSVPMQNQLVCSARFTYENLPYTTPPNRTVKFNAGTSGTASGDSIISYKWQFGNGATLTTTNKIVTNNYTQPGTYNVCLTITTALGCTRTECKVIVVTQSTSACVPHFTWAKTAPKQISFNSSMSWVPVGDTIISRTWNFGNATPLLTGNVISPVHVYQNSGVYTVSLKIKTVKNCEQTVYIPVNVQDSVQTPPNVEPVKIISIYPTPAQAQTQAVVWSQHNNVQAELAIYDVYGQKKWSLSKYLMQGNNVTVVPTAFLLPGPYYLRVTTVYGIKSRAFFKN